MENGRNFKYSEVRKSYQPKDIDRFIDKHKTSVCSI
jgi:hypothetical protein